MSYEPHNLSELETKIACHYLTKLEEHGWVAKYADDGGFDYEQLNSMDDALSVIDSVEVSMIFFSKAGRDTQNIMFVQGNEEDIVADNSIGDEEFAALCDNCMMWVELLGEE